MNSVVIGLGKMGLGFDLKSGKKDVFTHAKAYMLNKNLSLAGGIDPSPARRNEFKDFTGRGAYASIEDFADSNSDLKIDVVSICTPSDQRLHVVEDCIKHLSPKAILLEKPIALSFDEGYAIHNLCRKKKIFLLINYFRRFLSGFQMLRREISENKYGRIQSINVYYSKGLFNNASHFINILQFMFGRYMEVKWASERRKCPAIEKDFDVNFVLEGKGIDFFFHSVDERCFSLGEIDLIFERKRLLLYDYCFKMNKYSIMKDPAFEGYSKINRTGSCVSLIPTNYMSDVIEGMYNTIRKGQENYSDGASGLGTVRTCENVIRAEEVAFPQQIIL